MIVKLNALQTICAGKLNIELKKLFFFLSLIKLLNKKTDMRAPVLTNQKLYSSPHNFILGQENYFDEMLGDMSMQVKQ